MPSDPLVWGATPIFFNIEHLLVMLLISHWQAIKNHFCLRLNVKRKVDLVWACYMQDTLSKNNFQETVEEKGEEKARENPGLITFMNGQSAIFPAVCILRT